MCCGMEALQRSYAAGSNTLLYAALAHRGAMPLYPEFHLVCAPTSVKCKRGQRGATSKRGPTYLPSPALSSTISSPSDGAQSVPPPGLWGLPANANPQP